ncbi:MAG: hypothetical protein IIZ46_03795, partial [Clostridia bacterium]|nr:hypothetical protein [Clostridia bacterium]
AALFVGRIVSPPGAVKRITDPLECVTEGVRVLFAKIRRHFPSAVCPNGKKSPRAHLCARGSYFLS